MLIDEAGCPIYNQPRIFEKNMSTARIICLTATQDNGSAEGLERSVLNALRIRVFDAHVSESKEKEPLPSFERL